MDRIKSKTGLQALDQSIINPVFGYLFESVGGLNNIRFYSPEIEIKKENGTRMHSMDRSDDPLTSLVIELFPSPTGILCHIRNMNSNFGFNFLQNKQIGIDFLASAFSKLLTGSSLNDFTEYSNHEELRRIVGILMKNEKESMFPENNSLKLMTIHAFIINALDDKSDLERYILRILSKNLGTIKAYDLDFNILDEILKIQERYKSFPYSELNQPPSHSAIPIYDRENETFIEKTFSDCADILLLNICNCLFYDPERCQYNTEGLEADSALSKFYSNYRELFTITNEIRKEWSKVVQGLSDFETEDFSNFKIHLIVYLKEKRNEIKCGIINMMNVLIRICGIDHSLFWSDFDGFNIEQKVVDLFEIIFSKIKKERAYVVIDWQSFHKFISKDKMDFSGTFNLVFKQMNGDKIVAKVTHISFHTEMTIIENLKVRIKEEVIESNNISNFEENLPLLVLRNFILLNKDKSSELETARIFENIFLCGRIQTIEIKKEKLISICKYVLDSECKDASERELEYRLLNRVMTNMLETIDMNDLHTRKVFEPFLFRCDNLNDEAVIRCWLSSFGIENCKIYQFWESKILELKSTNILLDISGIPNSQFKYILETLRACQNITKMRILGINGLNREAFSKELRHFNQLTKLDLSYNRLGLEGIKIFAESIECQKSLVDLNLSNNLLGYKEAEIIANLIVKLENLENLNVSINALGLKGADAILKTLGNHPKLNTVDISRNFLYLQKLTPILEETKKLKPQLNINL